MGVFFPGSFAISQNLPWGFCCGGSGFSKSEQRKMEVSRKFPGNFRFSVEVSRKLPWNFHFKGGSFLEISAEDVEVSSKLPVIGGSFLELPPRTGSLLETSTDDRKFRGNFPW